jgi:hypothetical protein
LAVELEAGRAQHAPLTGAVERIVAHGTPLSRTSQALSTERLH